MSAIKFIQSVARKSLTKNQGSGIRSIPSAMEAEAEAGSIAAIFQQAGLPLNRLDDFIRSEADVLKYLNIIKNAKPVSTQEKVSGAILPFKQKRSFAEEIDTMKKSGDIVDEDQMIISDKITERDMFKNSFLNKPTVEGQMEKINKASNRIKEIKKEQADMYKPKSDAEIAAKYDKENKESIQRFKNKMKKDEPEDKADGGRIGFSGGKGIMAILKNLFVKPSGDDLKNFLSKRKFMKDIVGNTEKNKRARESQMLKEAIEEARKNPGFEFPSGEELRTEIEKKILPILLKDRKLNADGGRAGHYTGGMVDVEPNLSDIGHGSDTLMARTRLVSPDGQATTSTGLNYLLAEDNDNIRVPFSTGKLAGGIDSAIEKNKNLENMIALIEAKNKRLIDQGIKNAPEGVLMDPPPEKNDILYLGEEGTELNSMRDPRTLKRPSDLQSNTIIFDDGTIYYKDTDEYYREDGSQVPGPSKGAKIKPFVMEAAEGGRIGFSAGGGGRRAFLKLLATLTGGAAALKTGIIGLGGKETGKKAVTETIKQSAGSGTPPPYFFKLVEKIKTLGDDVTAKNATQERQQITRYKEYELTEDVGTGEQTIQKIKISDDGPQYYDETLAEETYINYKPGAGQSDEAGRVADEYIEDTGYLRTSGPQKGDLYDSEPGVPKDVIQEGTVFEDDITDFTTKKLRKKKAGGGVAYMLGQ